MGIVMDILLTGFCGTSAELLVKRANYKSLILPNDKVADSQLLCEEIGLQKYDYVFSFGQKPNIRDRVYLETTARNGNRFINTNFECEKLKNALEQINIPTQISDNAGTSFCNALYWNGLSYIHDKHLSTRMCFLHIPFYKNITDSELFFNRILAAIENV